MIADYLRLVSWKGDDGAAIRVGLDSIAALLSRARSAEALCRGMPIGSLPVEEAQKALLADISPIDDTRSTTHYRIVVTQNVLGKMLQE
jgi:xanthine dehydrogenase iron-sulfur cluster and FAD-binding subunit A